MVCEFVQPRDFACGRSAEIFALATISAIRRGMIACAAAMAPDFARELFLATLEWDPDRRREALVAVRVPMLLV